MFKNITLHHFGYLDLANCQQWPKNRLPGVGLNANLI